MLFVHTPSNRAVDIPFHTIHRQIDRIADALRGAATEAGKDIDDIPGSAVSQYSLLRIITVRILTIRSLFKYILCAGEVTSLSLLWRRFKK